MMIDILSDLHTEMNDYTFEDSDSDILILSGDTFVFEECNNPKTIFDPISSIYSDVIFILGNHEYYGGNVNDVKYLITCLLLQYKNIHLLEKNSIDIDGITFVGGTMWANMNNNNIGTIMSSWKLMNDFKLITHEVDGEIININPDFYMNEFDSFVKYLAEAISDNSKNYVVCTHHSPSFQSVPVRYRTMYDLNGAYSSNLDSFIFNHPQIKLWTHGHTHDLFDYKIGETRIVCNPRGYLTEYEGLGNVYKRKVVHIDPETGIVS